MIITEKKKIKIDHDCKDYPLYLTWLNKLGGYSYWLFFFSHEELTKTKAENQYTKFVPDLETSIGQIDITGKTAAPQLRFGANVKKEDMDGITGLYESPKVLLLVNPTTWETDGPKWKRIIINPGSLLKRKTGNEFLEVKMTMQLPLVNTQDE